MLREYKSKSVYQGSLSKGDELKKGLADILKENKITSGIISGWAKGENPWREV